MQLRQAAADARQALIADGGAEDRCPPSTSAVKDGVIFLRAEPQRRFTLWRADRRPAFELTAGRGRAAEEPEGPHGRRPAGAAPGRNRQGHRPPTRTCTTSACRACSTRAWFARPPSAPRSSAVDEGSVAGDQGRTQSCARAASSPSSPSASGRRSAPRASSRPPGEREGLPDQAKLWEHVRADEGRQGRRRRGPRQSEGRPRGRGADAQGRLRLRRPDPRLDRAVLRGRRREARQGRDLAASAGAASGFGARWPRRFRWSPKDIQVISSTAPAATAGTATRTRRRTPRSLQAVGRPVRVQWMRDDEHGQDPKGPPCCMRVRGGLDAQGSIVAWDSRVWTPKADIAEWPRTLAATLAGIPEGVPDRPGHCRTATSIRRYPFAHQKAVGRTGSRPRPSAPRALRAPGAHAEHLRQRVLHRRVRGRGRRRPARLPPPLSRRSARDRGARAAARMAKLEARARRPARDQSGPIARGRGIAYVKYENVRTYCAGVAEVEVEQADGRHPRAAASSSRTTAARSSIPTACATRSRASSPDRLPHAQGGAQVRPRARDQRRLGQPIPSCASPRCPRCDIGAHRPPGDPPLGRGRAGDLPAAPAISNAVFDAIGVRLRSVPYTPAALAAASKRA